MYKQAAGQQVLVNKQELLCITRGWTVNTGRHTYCREGSKNVLKQCSSAFNVGVITGCFISVVCVCVCVCMCVSVVYVCVWCVCVCVVCMCVCVWCEE